MFWSFQFFPKICGDIHKYRCTTGINKTGSKFHPGTTGVVDTGVKFATGVKDTSRKFVAGVKNTGGKFATGVNDDGDVNSSI